MTGWIYPKYEALNSDDLTSFNFFLTTLDEELLGNEQYHHNDRFCLPSGTYRVIDGELHQIIPGLSPTDIRQLFDKIEAGGKP